MLKTQQYNSISITYTHAHTHIQHVCIIDIIGNNLKTVEKLLSRQAVIKWFSISEQAL